MSMNRQPIGRIERTPGFIDIVPPDTVDDRIRQRNRLARLEKIRDIRDEAVEGLGQAFRFLISEVTNKESMRPSEDPNTNRRAGYTALALTGVLALGGVGLSILQNDGQSTSETEPCATLELNDLGGGVNSSYSIGEAASVYASNFPEDTNAYDFALEQLGEQRFVEVCPSDDAFDIAVELDKDYPN